MPFLQTSALCDVRLSNPLVAAALLVACALVTASAILWILLGEALDASREARDALTAHRAVRSAMSAVQAAHALGLVPRSDRESDAGDALERARTDASDALTAARRATTRFPEAAPDEAWRALLPAWRAGSGTDARDTAEPHDRTLMVLVRILDGLGDRVSAGASVAGVITGSGPSVAAIAGWLEDEARFAAELGRLFDGGTRLLLARSGQRRDAAEVGGSPVQAERTGLLDPLAREVSQDFAHVLRSVRESPHRSHPQGSDPQRFDPQRSDRHAHGATGAGGSAAASVDRFLVLAGQLHDRTEVTRTDWIVAGTLANAAQALHYEMETAAAVERAGARATVLARLRFASAGVPAFVLAIAALLAFVRLRRIAGCIRETDAALRAIAGADVPADGAVPPEPGIERIAISARMAADALDGLDAALAGMLEAQLDGRADARLAPDFHGHRIASLAAGINRVVDFWSTRERALVAGAERLCDGQLAADAEVIGVAVPGASTMLAQARAALIDLTDEIERLVDIAVQGTPARPSDGFAGAGGAGGRFEEVLAGLRALVEATARGLADVEDVFDAASQGDLTRVVGPDHPPCFDPVRITAASAMTGLAQLVARIREAASTVVSAGERVSGGYEEIAADRSALARALERAATCVEKLAAVVARNADSARRGDAAAREACVVAARSGATVRDLMETMRRIAASARRVEDIVGSIDGIAFQTNILALNAAVEASRAGELGRGFAAVAVEVRSLAQKSAAAAREIKGLIADSAGRIDTGVSLVHRAGTQMDEVVRSVTRVTELMQEVAAGATTEGRGIDALGRVVGEIGEIGRAGTRSVEIAAASVASLLDETRRLNDAVAVFRLDAGAPDALRSGAGVSQLHVQRPAASDRVVDLSARRPRAARAAGIRLLSDAGPDVASVPDEEWARF